MEVQGIAIQPFYVGKTVLSRFNKATPLLTVPFKICIGEQLRIGNIDELAELTRMLFIETLIRPFIDLKISDYILALPELLIYEHGHVQTLPGAGRACKKVYHFSLSFQLSKKNRNFSDPLDDCFDDRLQYLPDYMEQHIQ